ncbi:MAG TPA: 5-formyltetrahydrofolate cyclo-ligase [Steroidobacteraceae bacterium]
MAQPTPEVRATRRRLRELRLALGPAERAAAECAIRATLVRLGVFRRGAHVALYLPMRGEVDVRPCLEVARRHGSHLYVPRVVSRRRRQMLFAPWNEDGAHRTNAFGILEPGSAAGARPVIGLDVVVLPLVGFDSSGNRLGMGAGFYDRALRRRLDRSTTWRRPRLIGVAYACQQLPVIPASPWDVPLDLVVTERGVIVPGRAPIQRTDL